MQIRCDFSRCEMVKPQDYQWVQSPMQGVERMMLYRDGAERAIATSLVRYAPNAEFHAHEHPQGEEILVLEGIFAEGHVHYGAGSYLRSPPQSQHAPYSPCGALIFVKLRQMAASETQFVRLDTTQAALWQPHGTGISRCKLYRDALEDVALQEFAAHTSVVEDVAFCLELFVLSGSIIQLKTLDQAHAQPNEEFPTGTWLRLPAGEYTQWQAGAAGCRVYMNTKRAPVAYAIAHEA